MKIVEMSLDDLVPYKDNPRINTTAVDVVAKSIKRFGFNQPILIDQNKVICAGNTRYLAALKLNMKTIPTITKEMTEKEFIAYNVADNKVAEFSFWDEESLNKTMNELKDFDISLIDDIGFDDDYFDIYSNDTTSELDATSETVTQANDGSESNESSAVGESLSLPKQVKLLYNDVDHKEILEIIAILLTKTGYKNVNDLVINCLREKHSECK